MRKILARWNRQRPLSFRNHLQKAFGTNDAGLVGGLFGRASMNLTNLHKSNISRADFKNVRNLDKVHFGNACADDPPSFPDGFASFDDAMISVKIRRCVASKSPKALTEMKGSPKPAGPVDCLGSGMEVSGQQTGSDRGANQI